MREKPVEYLDFLRELEEANGDLSGLGDRIGERLEKYGEKYCRTINIDLEAARNLFERKPEILEWKDKDGGNLAHVLTRERSCWEDSSGSFSEKRKALLKLLEELKPGIIEEYDKKGFQPIIRAAIFGNKRMIRDLHAAGVSLETRDNLGCSIAFWAGGHGGRGIVQLLFEDDVDIFETERENGAFAAVCVKYKVAAKQKEEKEIMLERASDLDNMCILYERRYGYEGLKNLVLSRPEEFEPASVNLRARDLIDFSQQHNVESFDVREELSRRSEVYESNFFPAQRWADREIRREEIAVIRNYLGRER